MVFEIRLLLRAALAGISLFVLVNVAGPGPQAGGKTDPLALRFLVREKKSTKDCQRDLPSAAEASDRDAARTAVKESKTFA